MDNKKIILISAGVLGLGIITYFSVRSISKYRKAKRQRKEEEEQTILNQQSLQQIQNNLLQQEESNQTSQVSNDVIPIRDVNKAITNPLSQIKGKLLYPAVKSNNAEAGHPYASGYANIRTDPAVNTAQGWTTNSFGFPYYDGKHNSLGNINSPSSIGTIVAESYDNFDPPIRWLQVKLSSVMEDWLSADYDYGWVRADNVTFKKFPKKSSFSGFSGEDKFITKYDNSYQLGAEVFPHSNWMIGYPTYANDVTSDFEGNLDLDI